MTLSVVSYDLTLSAGSTHDLANDYGITTFTLTGNASGSTLTGIVPSNGDGDILILTNVGSDVITIAHNAGSTTTNRFQLRTGSDMSLHTGRHLLVRYDGDVGRWIEIADTAVYGVTSTTTASHAIGDTFGPFTRPTMVYYSVRIECTAVLAGGQRGRVELRSDTSNPPTTVRSRVAGGVTAPLVGLTTTTVTEGALSYFVPVGHRVRLVSVDELGTPTYTLTTQTEQAL